MILCPRCGVQAELSSESSRNAGIGEYFCHNEDCATCWFDIPNNAKLADAALDSLPTGRYQTPDVTAIPAASDEAFRAEFERRFPSLNFDFIKTMEEVGGLGRAKYGDNCIEARVKRGDTSRQVAGGRVYRREIAKHAREHFEEYIDGIKHDVFNTLRHQLAAAAFNPMIEFSISQVEGEPCAPLETPTR